MLLIFRYDFICFVCLYFRCWKGKKGEEKEIKREEKSTNESVCLCLLWVPSTGCNPLTSFEMFELEQSRAGTRFRFGNYGKKVERATYKISDAQLSVGGMKSSIKLTAIAPHVDTTHLCRVNRARFCLETSAFDFHHNSRKIKSARTSGAMPRSFVDEKFVSIANDRERR